MTYSASEKFPQKWWFLFQRLWNRPSTWRIKGFHSSVHSIKDYAWKLRIFCTILCEKYALWILEFDECHFIVHERHLRVYAEQQGFLLMIFIWLTDTFAYVSWRKQYFIHRHSRKYFAAVYFPPNTMQTLNVGSFFEKCSTGLYR